MDSPQLKLNEYEHSGKSPVVGFFLSLVIISLIAFVLAYFYSLFITFIPIVYFNVFITFGFGALLGYAAHLLSHFAKIRNRQHTFILAGVGAGMGFFCQWIAYLVILYTRDASFDAYIQNTGTISSPALFGSLVMEVNRVGAWSIMGVHFKGFGLWFVWTLEAILICVPPLLLVRNITVKPFSEELNKWYKKYTLKLQFESIALQNLFCESLTIDPVQAINSLTYGQPYRYSLVSLYYLPNEKKQYLTVENVHVETRGKGNHVKTPVVHLLTVNTSEANQLMEKYGARKQLVF